MKGKDRYFLNQFHSGPRINDDYLCTQKVNDLVFKTSALALPLYKMDFDENISVKERNSIVNSWITTLPKLKNVKKLSIRNEVKQEFFDSICEMTNLEELYFRSSRVENIKAISRLKNVKRIRFDSFSRLQDVSPLLKLNQLVRLEIMNCFSIKNYEVIGKLTNLVGLAIKGYDIGPRNLKLSSLSPFVNLSNLKHLDISHTSVVDKNYLELLKFPKLERFDILLKIPKDQREKIFQNNRTIKAGLFMDWDWDKNKLKEGKEW